MKLFYHFTGTLFTVVFCFFHAVNAQETLPLYPQGLIPNAKPVQVAETVYGTEESKRRFIVKITEPTLTIYLPPLEKRTGIGVIICPGGGYSGVAIDHEGHDMAKAFNTYGIAAFVLKYRMPDGTFFNNKTTVPLQDAQRAIYLVRENVGTWGVDMHKLGILGSSAGGHLASTAATHHRRTVTENPKQFSLRPDFLILNYPVISFADSLTHHGSRYNLIGALDGEARNQALAKLPEAKEKLAFLKVDRALVREYSIELQVNSDTPPTFITHAVDDDVVPVANSLLFIAALQQHGVEVRSFFYSRGGHGYGMDNPTASRDWFEPMVQWLLQLPALKK